MRTDSMSSKVNWFFDEATNWQKEFDKLRSIVLDCRLSEELKWGCPCYTFSTAPGGQRSNIVLIHGFKEYCALLFFKGALLNDAQSILVQQTKNVQSARQVRFTSIQEINKMKAVLKSFIYEAIEVEKAGLKVDLKKTKEYKIPAEFQKQLDKSPVLNTAFKALTPGRQRGYLLYFSAPKQSKTRESRVEKYIQPILNGKGLND